MNIAAQKKKEIKQYKQKKEIKKKEKVPHPPSLLRRAKQMTQYLLNMFRFDFSWMESLFQEKSQQNLLQSDHYQKSLRHEHEIYQHYGNKVTQFFFINIYLYIYPVFFHPP